jgi:RND family efflux transporter MFP subunit
VELHYYYVLTPTDGIVGDIPVRVGDRVTTSTVLTTVDEPGNLELYVPVPVERSKDLKLGQLVQVLDAAGNVQAECRTDFISPEVDTTAQSVLVKATVANRSGTLRTSQFVQARIIWGTRTGLMIPVLAVSRINGQFFVFVVERNGKSLLARQKMLQLGEMMGNQYAVLSGLQAEDHVVVEGGQDLTDGTPVTEKPEDSIGRPSR